MHHQATAALIDKYQSFWSQADYQSFNQAEETQNAKSLLSFVSETPEAFERTNLTGHVTGSALVVTKDFKRVLLTHHRKLDKWLQLGGHADGDCDIAAVARREAEEESGLGDLTLVDPAQPGQQSVGIFDLDIHEIPARLAEPKHFHYDIRFLMVSDQPESIVMSSESKDLRWMTWLEAMDVTTERSMLRQFDKAKWLHAHCFQA